MLNKTLGDGLALIDWTIILLYALGTIALGYYYGRRQTTLEEYFTGGGRMNPTLVGCSMFATLLSTISYLSVSGEAISKGPAGMANLLSLPLTFLIVAYVFIPVFMRNRVTSAYELLEARLGLRVRMLGAVMFLVLQLISMSMLLYLTAKAMSIILGLDESSIPWIAFLTGLVAVIYTSLGGLRAVVVTDTLQGLLMLGGAWMVVAIVTYRMGGLGWVPTSWQPHWDEQPLFSFDPSVRMSVGGAILYSIVLSVSAFGSNQTMIQRFMATTDVKSARRSLWASQVANVVVVLTLWIAGFALLGFFQEHSHLLPVGIDTDQNGDKVFPYFIAFLLPPGVSGLVVVAMFAAGMSSIDSGVNSITAVINKDFLERFGRQPATQYGRTRLAKALALGIGFLVILGSSFLEQVPGNIWAVGEKASLLVTPLFALFVFALFVPFATPVGVMAGALSGITTAVTIAFSGPIFGMDATTGSDPVSFIWIAPVALAVNLLVGTLALPFTRNKGLDKEFRVVQTERHAAPESDQAYPVEAREHRVCKPAAGRRGFLFAKRVGRFSLRSVAIL